MMSVITILIQYLTTFVAFSNFSSFSSGFVDHLSLFPSGILLTISVSNKAVETSKAAIGTGLDIILGSLNIIFGIFLDLTFNQDESLVQVWIIYWQLLLRITAAAAEFVSEEEEGGEEDTGHEVTENIVVETKNRMAIAIEWIAITN